jgi:hypothetical protein
MVTQALGFVQLFRDSTYLGSFGAASRRASGLRYEAVPL